MKKLAVFVEGQTEQLFIERLITEIAGANNIVIEKRKLTGGSRSISRWVQLWTSASDPGRRYFILIIDCTGYTTVKSDIRDNYESLVSKGYNAIIGIRDVYPEFTYAEVGKLRLGLNCRLKTKPVQVVFVLGVMEIETWFISEHTHFSRVDPALTIARINATLGLDPSVDDIQLRPIPSEDLDAIYQLVGQRYKKDYHSTQQLLNRLDYTFLYCDVLHRLPDLNVLVESMNAFLTP
jgi:hypothetical protein